MILSQMKVLEKYNGLSLPVKAGLWFTICSILQRGISVISMPIFTRLLPSSDFGEYNLYLSWYMVFSLVVTLNIFAEVFNKGLVDNEQGRDSFVSGQIGLLSCLFLAFSLVYVVIHDYVNRLTGLSTLLTSFAMLELFANAIVSFWYARARFEYRYKKLIAVSLSIAISGVVFGALFTYFSGESDKVIARVLGGALPSVVVAIPLLISSVKKSKALFQFTAWRTTLALAVPLLPHYLSQILLNQSDKVMIGWYCDTTSVAIYSIAHSAGLLMITVTNGMNSAFVPWVYGKLKSKNWREIGPATYPLCVIVLALNFLLVLFAPELVAILSTSDYADACWCIAPIATSVVFCFFYSLFTNIEIFYGKTGFVAVASIVAAVLNVVLNLIAIPVFGYVAAAYTTAISYFVTMLLHYFFVNSITKKEGIPSLIDVRVVLTLSFLMVVLSGIAMVMYPMNMVRLGTVVAVCALMLMFRKQITKAVKILRK